MSLMRLTIQAFQDKLERLRLTKECLKNQLFLSCHKNIANNIIALIRSLNGELYNFLATGKENKMEKLIPPTSHSDSSNQNIPPSENDELDEIVRCIPDSVVLSKSEKSLLSKGLNFVPTTPLADSFQNETDIQQFFRRLLLKAFFHGKENQESKSPDDQSALFSKFHRSKSEFTPKSSWYPVLDRYFKSCQNQIDNLNTKPLKRHNLTPEEQTALRNLKARTDIVIKAADKGGAVVAWDSQCYVSEGDFQLSDTKFYTKLRINNTKENQKTVKRIIQTSIDNEELPEEAYKLVVSQPRTSRFYMLPKIHKLGNPGRPIVSACSCPTEHISSFLHDIFMPIVENLPTYVKDTTHALNIIEFFQPENDDFRLFTMDVTALYTSIPNNEAMVALKHFLDRRPNPYINTDIILRLAELVLNLNTFQFDGEHYSQSGGVAMGTKMGPSFACLFMGYLEEKMFSEYIGPVPDLYKRFIDDVFGVSSDSEQELRSFIEYASSYHPAIKYTFNITQDSLSFLDIKCTIKEGQISTSVFYKPTDAHCYLNYESCHPQPCKDAIPKSQFLRLRRLCSDDVDFTTQCSKMKSFFVKRGYPGKVLDRAVTSVSRVTRTTAMEKKVQGNDDRVPLVLTYHPHNLAIKNILISNFKSIVLRDEYMSTVFSESLPIAAFRKGKSLKQHLVTSSFKSATRRPPANFKGTRHCKRSRCSTCPFTWETDEVIGPSNTFKLKNGFTCVSENVVYAVRCKRCTMLYVGETCRRLGDRFVEHKQSVTNGKDCPVGEHFRQNNHSINDMQVTVLLETCSGEKQRQFLEQRIIHFLGTARPFGMNVKKISI